jgi:hypothetical protein
MIGLLLSVAAIQSPAFFTGNQLYSICQTDRSACQMYVAGAYDMTSVYEKVLNKLTVCSGEGVVLDQATDVVINYLRNHPETRGIDAPLQISTALMAAWPCH